MVGVGKDFDTNYDVKSSSEKPGSADVEGLRCYDADGVILQLLIRWEVPMYVFQSTREGECTRQVRIGSEKGHESKWWRH